MLILPVSALASSVIWVSVPWLLLDRRVAWRRLVPAGVLTAACTAVYGVASIVYIPRLMETYSRRYGLFGVTLALVGWLLCIAVIIVAATAVAAELDRAPDQWARRLRTALGIEPVAEEPREDVAVQLTTSAAGPEGRPVA